MIALTINNTASEHTTLADAIAAIQYIYPDAPVIEITLRTLSLGWYLGTVNDDFVSVSLCRTH